MSYLALFHTRDSHAYMLFIFHCVHYILFSYMLKSCRFSCMTCFRGTVQFGIAQRLPMATNERESTETRLASSIEYMQRIWKDGAESKNVRYKCKNVHEDCSFWAASGECEKNPTYMNLNCAPACYTCDKLDMRHRCPIEPDNPSIWDAGDLNAMMERIVDDTDNDGEFVRYNPKALSRPMLKRDGSTVTGIEKDGPWIVVLENFVSSEEADRLVEIGKRQGYDRSADVGKEKPDGTHESKVSDSRTSHNTWCKEGCHDDPLVSPVIARIANITRTEDKNSEYLQLLQYEPGQYYKQHHDYIGHHKEKPCGVRILTLFIYLNDVEEDAGGGTRFSLLNITVQPKKGSAVLWPSVLDEAPEDKDGRTDHEALPVLKGLKYGANAWIHNRDYKKAYTLGCQ